MSFDIFIFAFDDGEPRRFLRIVLEKAFGSFSDMSDPTWWSVSDSFAVIQLDAAAEIDNFGVNRPPHFGHPFWPALLDVLRETSSVLFWPGGGPVATDQSVAARLPEGMIEEAGGLIVVSSVAEIARAIESS